MCRLQQKKTTTHKYTDSGASTVFITLLMMTINLMKPGLMATDSWETGAAQPECHNHTHTQKEGTVQAKSASSSPVKQTDGLIIKRTPESPTRTNPPTWV